MKNGKLLLLLSLSLLFSSCVQRHSVAVIERESPLFKVPPEKSQIVNNQPIKKKPTVTTPPVVKKPSIPLAPPLATPSSKPPKKEQIHIVLDAGHGGKDKGTFSEKNKYEEKERTLKTTKIVKSYLEDLGYQITMTRNSDVFISLPKRAEIANATAADLFVSIHYNHSENSDVDGVEIFYYKDEKNPFSPRILASKKLGELVLARILKHTGANTRGVKKANFAVVRETKMPAILIEAGFLSNAKERERIQEESYLCYMGWAIARGIDSYCENTL